MAGITRRSALAAAAGLAAGATRPSKRPPNFIVILTDDQGYQDLGCFGSPDIATPHIDRMAREGRKLTSFTVQPICSPSRAALLTGCYPQRVGIPTVLFPHDKTGLSPAVPTISSLLKAHGYDTYCIGKWHLGRLPGFLPTDHGFDGYFGVPYSNDMQPAVLMRDDQVIEEPYDNALLTKRYTEEAVAYIRRRRDRPFFLYLNHTMPHVPLGASPAFAGRSKRGPYGDAIEEIDWSTGQVLDALRETGQDRDTLVIFTSDNGPWLEKGRDAGSAAPLRDGKFSVYEGGIRTPCIAWWPGRVPAGTECSELAASMDLLPTFLRLAGAPPAGHAIDGRDIWSLLSGRRGARSPHDALFFLFLDRVLAVRRGPWKLVINKEGASELYDVVSDPFEQRNLAAEHPRRVAAMRRQIETLQRELSAAR